MAKKSQSWDPCTVSTISEEEMVKCDICSVRQSLTGVEQCPLIDDGTPSMPTSQSHLDHTLIINEYCSW